MDAAEEVGGGFIVARCDAPELFQLGEEVFNQVARFIEFFVVFSLFDAIGFWRDDDVDARFFQEINHSFIRIKGFVREQRLYFFKNAGQTNIRSIQIVRLAGREMKARGIAERIATRMDLGRQTALAAAYGLSGAGVFGFLPPFLRTPAEC